MELALQPSVELSKYYPEHQVKRYQELLGTNNSLYMAIEPKARSRKQQLVNIFVEVLEQLGKALDDLKMYRGYEALKSIMAKKYLEFLTKYGIREEKIEDILLKYLEHTSKEEKNLYGGRFSL